MLSYEFTVAVMVFEAALLSALILGPRYLSAFASRKICHGFSGACMILIGSDRLIGRLFVYAVTVVSLVMTWKVFPGIPTIWFGSTRDPGITIYLLVVALWFYMQLPVGVLGPVFFADPAGAVVGRYMSKHHKRINPRWIGDKTVLGSLAVFIATLLSASVHSQTASLLVAITATLGEAIGGSFDNLLIAVTVIISYSLSL